MASCSSRSAVFSREAALCLSLLCLRLVRGDIDLFIKRDSLYNDLRLSFSTDIYLIKDGKPGYLLSSPKGLKSLLNPLVPSMRSVALTWFANPRLAVYSIDIRSSDTGVMPHPKLTIPKKGNVLHANSDFKVFFPCSSDKSGIVDIWFSLNYTNIELGQVQSKNQKSLTFAVRRQCASSSELEQSAICAHCANKIQVVVYALVVVCAVCFILVVVLVCLCLHLYKKSKQKKDAEGEPEITTSTDNVSEIRPNRPTIKVVAPTHNLSPPRKMNGHIHRPKHGSKPGTDVTPRRPNFTSITESVGEEDEEEETEALMSKLPNSTTEDNALKQIKEPNYLLLKTEWFKKLKHLVIPPEQIKITKDVLGTGSYSCVYRGVARLHPREPYRKDEVAVKCLRDKSDVDLMECLVSEANLMRELRHSNVIGLLGVCIPSKQPLHLVLQYTKNGNLHSYLTQCKNNTELVPLIQLLNFAQQIAKGMEFIASKQLVHRNLKSRNCLVHKDKSIKISDFALARHVGYPRLNKLPKPFPVKWTAPEGLTQPEKFTEKSDVWSYGVVLWEIFTHAMEPYKNIEDCDIAEHLSSGNRLSQPGGCPDQLFITISKCWLAEAKERPSFALLSKRLKACESSLKPSDEESSCGTDKTSSGAEKTSSGTEKFSCGAESKLENGSVVSEVERESSC